ncbi:hypothetical protein DPMN_010520 [Dreissena polymorpha]|uniref:Uncharacterized protein n=1 Tax=Dreissena polymorpha TaxID=45954 RepID=A0A9D4N3C8_DREPO|nr:hypothetical protein DPMN_010520 [Dreissena polymorpha]
MQLTNKNVASVHMHDTIKQNARCVYIQIERCNFYLNTLPYPGGHVFQQTGNIFELVQDIIGTNLLTKFHEDPTINVASTVLTRRIFMMHNRRQTIDKRKNAPPLGAHINFLTKFHDNRTINVASRVLTRKMPWCPYIIETILLTKFLDNRTINVASRELIRKNATPSGGHVFQPTGPIFELIQDIIGTNLLTKFHEDRTINAASRVLTRKNAPPPVFKATVTIFELVQDIMETNLLTKFYEDWTINVASRVLTRQMLTPHDGRRTKGDHKSIVLR